MAPTFEPSTLEAAAEQLAQGLRTLNRQLNDPRGAGQLLRLLGWELPPGVDDIGLAGLDVAEAIDELDALRAIRASGTDEAIADAYAELVGAVARALVHLRDAAAGFTATPDYLARTDIVDEFFPRLLDLVVMQTVGASAPVAFAVGELCGIFVLEAHAADPASFQTTHLRHVVRWDRLETLLTDPAQLLREVYGWGTADFAADPLILRIAEVIQFAAVSTRTRRLPRKAEERLAGRPVLEATDDPALQLFVSLVKGLGLDSVDVGVTLYALRADTPGGADGGLGLSPYLFGTDATSFPLSDTTTLVLSGSAQLEGGMAVVLRAGRDPELLTGLLATPVAGSPTGAFRMELEKAQAADATATLIFAGPGATRLEAEGFTLGVGGEDGDFYVAAGLKGLRLVIDVADDALLSQIVPEPIAADAGDLVGGWRAGRGIYFEQGSALGVRFPLSVVVAGVVRLRQLGLALEFQPDVTLTATVSGELSLGPLFLVVEDLGFRIAVSPNPNGRFGTFDLDAGVRSPAGYAAHLDAGVISGGGQIQKNDHEYRGTLSLRFESFGLSAFAILTTRMPSGQPGVSFLASIFGDVQVQLGYGFKLTGIGGIIGIDRRVDVDQLGSVLAEGRLDSVLFPPAPIKDAAVILDDMAAIYPPARGQYLIGPMAKLAWGTPTLIEGKLGVILEVGDETRAVVVGSLEAVLPERSAAIVVLRLDFIGTVELASGAVGFDATLTSSRILSWPVTGEAAVRTGWGPSAGLVASVGGFHPAFSPPAGFPALRPMTIDFATNNPSLTLTAYLAITLGSVQAGAEASLYAKGPKIPFVGRFAVEGSAGFDALVHFDPFAFDAKLWLALDLLFRGDVVCGIGGDLRLRGPNRYEIKGKLRVKALGVTVKVGIDKAWGTPVTETPQRVDGVEVLQAAVETAQGFEPIPVPTRVSGVGFARRQRGQDTVLVDPAGGVRFVQRALPLAVPIDRIGTSRLTGKATTFDLAFTDRTDGSEGTPAMGADAESEFVRGAFFDLSESERLRGPATEPHKSGIELRGADDLVFDEDAAQHFDPEYETIVLGDDEEDTQPVTPHPLDAAVAERLVRLTAETTTAPLNSNYVPVALAGERVGVAPISYVAVGDAAVAGGPTPVPTPDGDLAAGPLTSVTRRLGSGQRAVARYLAAPAGPGG